MEDKNRVEEIYQEAEKLLEEGKWKEGEQNLHKALEVDPDYAPALNKIGVIHAKKKELDLAEEFFERALESDPEYVPALTNMGNIYQQKEELDKAIEYYQRALEIDPDYGPLHNNLGAAYKKKGDLKKAVDHLKKARKKGSYAVDTDKPLLTNPGCLLVMGLLAVLIVVVVLSMK